jgi:hypothetical protein
MIITKEGVTREKLVELLNYSLTDECRFPYPLKPEARVFSSNSLGSRPCIRLLEAKEAVFQATNTNGEMEYSWRFFLKVCIEDNYWEPIITGGTLTGYRSSGIVPPAIKLRVAEILS